jgi:tetratricopeptide (TPR) repeat protein
MSRTILALLLIVSVGRSTWSSPLEDVTETLARAEALYYEADFNKSIELLSQLDEELQSQSGHQKEKISVKMQLALSYLGLNNNAQAKAYFQELYTLDLNHVIDPQQFSPKVIQLAEQVKAEQNEIRCRSVSGDADQQLMAGRTDAVMQLVRSNQAKCPGLAALMPTIADLLFKDGVAAYKKSQLAEASLKFRNALQFQPGHDLAAQYLELAESKLALNADRTFLSWRKDFDAGEYALAATSYRQLVAVSSADTITQVRDEYRKALTSLVEAWNRACTSNDTVTMEEIRLRVNELLPDTSIGADIIAKMSACKSTGCIPMTAQLALARLKTRVDPEFPPYVRSQVKVSPVTVRVKTKINEKGDVAFSEPQGGNAVLYSSVKAAVDRWKFYPAIIQGSTRCVETEIPITINFSPAN